MKKLIMTAAIAATVLTAGQLNAQSTQAKEAPKMEVQAQDDFKEIKATDIPAAVTKAVQRDFEGAAIAQAFVNDKKEYKLVLAVEGQEPQTVYANAEGEWIKK